MAPFTTVTETRPSDQGTCRRIHLIGAADISNIASLTRALDVEVAAHPACIILNLTRLTFLDSTALMAILTAARNLQAAGGTLTATNPTGLVWRILQVTGADTILMPGAGTF